MIFNSIEYLIFFPIVVIVFFMLNKKLRNPFLLIASYYFYMQWNSKYALLIGFSTLITYLSGILIEKANLIEDKSKREKRKKLYVFLSFIINLSILFIFKYANFAIEIVNYFTEKFAQAKFNSLNLLLPVGISFYTFQALSYTMDVYRNDVKAEHNIINYALFVSFFPQLVAGPIERSGNLLSQINQDQKFSFNNLYSGFSMIIWGLFLKLVIADRISILVDKVYFDYTQISGAVILFATALFSIQLYCDFYSYSIIAKGSAKIMGFNIMDNFKQPFLSTSIAEFWRRWHISLSSWFKDYLYFPLGGSRKGEFRKYINLFIVFLTSGLWHGASMAFVAWGALHGIYILIESLLLKFRNKYLKFLAFLDNLFIIKTIKRLIVFVLFTFSMYFFRGGKFNIAIDMIRKSNYYFKSPNFLKEIENLGLNQANLIVLGLSLLALYIVGRLREGEIFKFNPFPSSTIFLLIGIFTVLIFGVYGPGFSESQFIYFQF